MVVLDAQVHTWFSDRPGRPWDPSYRASHLDKPAYLQHAGQTNSPDMVLEQMTAAEVDGALLVPLGVYGKDIELELGAASAHPSRMRVIGVVDHLEPGLAQHLETARSRGLVGVRLLELREPDRVARGEFEHALAACADLGLVVALSLRHPLDPRLIEIFGRFRGVFFMIDHLGTGFAPPILGYRPENPFEQIATVISLAKFPNVGLKLTGAPSLSFELYPFRDIWEPVQRLITGFGADRVFWGSDFSRTSGMHSYHEARHYLAEIPTLSHEQCALVYGDALANRVGWSDVAGQQTVAASSPMCVRRPPQRHTARSS